MSEPTTPFHRSAGGGRSRRSRSIGFGTRLRWARVRNRWALPRFSLRTDGSDQTQARAAHGFGMAKPGRCPKSTVAACRDHVDRGFRLHVASDDAECGDGRDARIGGRRPKRSPGARTPRDSGRTRSRDQAHCRCGPPGEIGRRDRGGGRRIRGDVASWRQSNLTIRAVGGRARIIQKGCLPRVRQSGSSRATTCW